LVAPAAAGPLRFVTAASLFDGHDAAINIMRRIIQSQGAEVIHLGHNRSVEDVVRAALQEDADAIALSSYQGGHVEYFKYMVDMLKERGAGHIRVFGGGGGTITPEEIKRAAGLRRRAHLPPERRHEARPHRDDRRRDASRRRAATERAEAETAPCVDIDDEISIGHMLSAIEEGRSATPSSIACASNGSSPASRRPCSASPAPAAPASPAWSTSCCCASCTRFPRCASPCSRSIPRVAVPAARLLGDRIRMNSLRSHRVYMRSMATRRQHAATSIVLHDCIDFLKSQPYDLVIVETAGIGQSDSEIVDLVDFPVYVMTSEYGAASQLEKIDMIDFAELVVLNKFDKRGAEDALRDVRKQWKRNRTAFS
jgi:methylmalonyl-CoA mutase